MTRWVRAYWDEEDVTFFLEVGEDGWVTRHVELAGPGGEPRAATSLVEWMSELDAGRIHEYQAKYGGLADQPIVEWDFPHEDLTHDEYDAIWANARHALESRA